MGDLEDEDWGYTMSNNPNYHGIGPLNFPKGLARYSAKHLKSGAQTTVAEVRSLLSEKER